MFAVASQSDSSPTPGTRRGSGRSWKTSNPRKVLIVEDDLDAARAFDVLLRQMGHIVQYAINGYAAIDLAKRFQPDFIFLDLGLPGLDGYEVCSRLKSEPGFERTRIIAVTAYGQDEARARSQAAGCEMHLVKPVPPILIEQILG